MQEFLSLLKKNQKQLAEIVTDEHGKVLADAMGSVQRGIEVVEFACGIPHLLKGEYSENVGTQVDTHTLRQPVGVCAGITPFNFPVMVPLWMFPMAIACGNTFILKPSEKFLPPRCAWPGSSRKRVSPTACSTSCTATRRPSMACIIRAYAISFVGSTPIAKYIYETAAKHGKRVQALGGAKNHAVVLPDADLEFAADALIGAAYGSAGERCMAISAVVAVGAAGDPLVKLLEKKAKAIKLGVDMGPLVTEQHRTKVSSFIEKGVDEGAKLVVDARKQDVPKEGFYLGTSLFDYVTPDMEIYKNEIFGPVLVVLRADTLEEAVALVNRNPYANGTAIFTESGGAARRFAAEIQVGMVGINVPIPVPVAFYSFGGWKSSLFGDLHARHRERKVLYAHEDRDHALAAPGHAGAGFNMPTLG